jgi:hypothetical protein
MALSKIKIESEDKEAASEERLVTVQLLRPYVPANSEPEVIFEEQGLGKRAKDARTEIFAKVPAGTVLDLPLSEARKLLEDVVCPAGRTFADGSPVIIRPAVAKLSLGAL